MWKCLSKYVCIFLLLTLSGVFFLFRNISILEWKLDLCIWELCSNHAEGPTPLDHNQSCNHLSQGQERTPEEALEEHYLLESIAWPEPPPRPTSIPLEQTSDPAHSHFAVLPASGWERVARGGPARVSGPYERFPGTSQEAMVGDFLAGLGCTPQSWGGRCQTRCWNTRMGPTSADFPVTVAKGSVTTWRWTLIHLS